MLRLFTQSLSWVLLFFGFGSARCFFLSLFHEEMSAELAMWYSVALTPEPPNNIKNEMCPW